VAEGSTCPWVLLPGSLGRFCSGQGACGSAWMRLHAVVIASAHGQLAWIFRWCRRPPQTSRAADAALMDRPRGVYPASHVWLPRTGHTADLPSGYVQTSGRCSSGNRDRLWMVTLCRVPGDGGVNADGHPGRCPPAPPTSANPPSLADAGVNRARRPVGPGICPGHGHENWQARSAYTFGLAPPAGFEPALTAPESKSADRACLHLYDPGGRAGACLGRAPSPSMCPPFRKAADRCRRHVNTDPGVASEF